MGADYVQTLIELRNGQVASECSNALQTVLAAVLDTGKKGAVSVKLDVVPTRVELGRVVEVEVTHKITETIPDHNPGKTIFFPMPDGTLSRHDPAQIEMFGSEVKNG